MHAIDEHHGESDSMSEDDAMISSSSDDADKTDPDYFNSNNQIIPILRLISEY